MGGREERVGGEGRGGRVEGREVDVHTLGTYGRDSVGGREGGTKVVVYRI